MAEEINMDDPKVKAAIKAAVDGALADARAEFNDEVAGLKSKNRELIGKLRDANGVKPEDLTVAEQRAEKAEADLAEATKQVKALTGERDKAVKALEVEQGAARSYALEAELSGAIAEGNVVPSLVPALKAMLAGQAKADLADGKYSVTIGDKAAREHIKAFLDSDEGKAFKAANVSGGGGAPGSGGGGGGAAQITKSEYTRRITSGEAATINQQIREGKLTVTDDKAA